MDNLPWVEAPYFYKKYKILGRLCHECGECHRHVYLVVTPTRDFYVCEKCKELYKNKTHML